jgi:putative acetyltransferase
MALIFRSMTPADNAALAKIVRDAFIEFGMPQEGTVYTDPSTDHLYDVFRHPGSAYFIAEEDGVVLGGCGVYPTDALTE